MKDKLILFWSEYTKSINWVVAAIWFILLNIIFWDNWNLSKFFMLIGFFVFVTLYIWLMVTLVKNRIIKSKNNTKNMEKFRILEKKYASRSEYHPQKFLLPITIKQNKIKKFFGAKDIERPGRWISLLEGTIDFGTGKSSKHEAELVIEEIKKKHEEIIDVIIHEI